MRQEVRRKRSKGHSLASFYQILNLSHVLCSDIMNNKVFYQHPNLMRALGMHETVMEVMVNVLSGGDSKVRAG